MKLSKKLLYSAMAFTMLTSATVALVAQIIPSSTVRAETVGTIPQKTTVKIYKLQADNYTDAVLKDNGLRNENGDVIDFKNLGRNVRGLSGVTFTAFKITDDATKDDLKKLSLKELKQKYNETKVLTPTADNGLTTWELAKADNGRYWVVESTKPETVSNSVAVPFEISFPMSKSDGTGYLTEVNIYPKNVTGEKPKVDKDVTKLGNDDDSYAVGEEIKWFLKAMVPSNFKDYNVFKLTDTLETSLSFLIPNENSIGEVKFGDKVLVKEQDYQVIFDNAMKKVSVELTPTGIKNVSDYINDKVNPPILVNTEDGLYKATTNSNNSAFLSVELKAIINESAVMGKRINNNVELEYKRNPDQEVKKEKIPDKEVPEVHTGGRIFKKVDVNNPDGNGLSGAEFGLYSDELLNTPITWTDSLIKANKAAIDAGKFKENTPRVGDSIILKSSQDGTFEIKGLSYGARDSKKRTDETAGNAEETGQTLYYLKETKAPAGYVIPEGPIKFEVNATSYYKDSKTIQSGTAAADAEPQKVENNKRPSIPNTGGIGTAIFVVVGVIIMFVAARGMRCQKEDN
ncbi:TPA: SpaH/EbpB family LPXTG-anchored major pilin [Streptococcus pyogenes]